MGDLTTCTDAGQIGQPEVERPAGSKLEKCPSCDYALGGLPGNHRCPECGLVYDEHSRVWRPQRRFWFIRFTIIFGIVTPISVRHAFGDPLSASLLSALDLSGLEWALTAVWSLLVLAASLWMRSVYRNQYCTATLPDGLLVRCGRSRLIPWADIAAVEGISSMVRIRRVNGRGVALGQFFADRYEVEAFESQIAEAQRRCRQRREG